MNGGTHKQMGNGITKRKTWIILLEAFLIGVLAFVFCYNDILYPLDSLYKDRVYQRSRGVNQNIKIIAIDEKTLAELGPFGTWDRSVYADIIDYLGEYPAVIGFDLLFISPMTEEGDTALRNAALKNGNVEENYIVSGLCQTMNNMGQMAYMTFDGLRRTGDTINSYTLNVMFKEGHEYQEFEREFKDMYPDMEVDDFKVAYENSVGVIRIGMEGFTILIAVITVAIVAFVEALIIRTQVTREWRNLGVSKALGFTSGQLIVQTMLSNIPSILMGVFAGLLLAIKSTAKVMMAAMSIFGFRNVDINLRPQSYLFTAVIIIGVAMGTSAFIGRRIKVLEPVKMITEE